MCESLLLCLMLPVQLYRLTLISAFKRTDEMEGPHSMLHATSAAASYLRLMQDKVLQNIVKRWHQITINQK